MAEDRLHAIDLLCNLEDPGNEFLDLFGAWQIARGAYCAAIRRSDNDSTDPTGDIEVVMASKFAEQIGDRVAAWPTVSLHHVLHKIEILHTLQEDSIEGLYLAPLRMRAMLNSIKEDIHAVCDTGLNSEYPRIDVGPGGRWRIEEPLPAAPLKQQSASPRKRAQTAE